MDFAVPADIQETLDQLDAFIESEIKPLQAADDNERFFDHRREWSRTDFENDGVPTADWEALLREMRRRADAAGWLRLALPKEFGGQDASNLKMAVIREHLATKGLGLHN
ncbi:MAG: acyl-CoA dehydrogenase, partial [Actinobacteria bacterium]|nr:acyl-CoA dehydrogenase [Actinomycetota bacterium]